MSTQDLETEISRAEREFLDAIDEVGVIEERLKEAKAVQKHKRRYMLDTRRESDKRLEIARTGADKQFEEATRVWER